MSNDQMDQIPSARPFITQDLPFNNVMPTMVKIDVRSYPEFDGTLKNWKSHKQKFKSIASMQLARYQVNQKISKATMQRINSSIYYRVFVS